jgi:hypothetical protein
MSRARSAEPHPGSRLALGMALAGLVPFLAGWLLGKSRCPGLIFGVPCPIRATFGIPCPACGSTRAFVSVAAGDGEWRRYNFPAVIYAVGLIGAAAALTMAPMDRGDQVARALEGHAIRLRSSLKLTLITALIVATPPWLAALRMRR